VQGKHTTDEANRLRDSRGRQEAVVAQALRAQRAVQDGAQLDPCTSASTAPHPCSTRELLRE
jgi:hypothetical protein